MSATNASSFVQPSFFSASSDFFFDYLPTNSLESEVVEMTKMQYTAPIILARQKIVKLYADRNKSPRKPRKSMLVDESMLVVESVEVIF